MGAFAPGGLGCHPRLVFFPSLDCIDTIGAVCEILLQAVKPGRGQIFGGLGHLSISVVDEANIHAIPAYASPALSRMNTGGDE